MRSYSQGSCLRIISTFSNALKEMVYLPLGTTSPIWQNSHKPSIRDDDADDEMVGHR
jgi:hypothetical protein